MCVCRGGGAPHLGGLGGGPPAAVEEAVDAQRGPAGEGFAAELAAVGFLPAVQHQVLLQVPLQAVGLLAVRAGERALAAVTHLL